MAEREDRAEDDREAAESAVAAAAKKKKLVMLAVVGLVVLLIASGGTWMALGALGGGDVATAGGATAGDEASAPPLDESVATEKESFYEPLDPPFLANFMVGGRQHYLQLAMTVMARDETSIKALKTHMLLVRNRIVMLLSGESFEDLQTDAGRRQLQQKLSAAIQEILNKEIGRPGIEQVFFTNFVMQ